MEKKGTCGEEGLPGPCEADMQFEAHWQNALVISTWWLPNICVQALTNERQCIAMGSENGRHLVRKW